MDNDLKDDKTPLLSVIVPVYRVEQYLHRCVDSIINQTYKNLEIILVDDGSPDNSGKFCDKYALVDSRIKVIHQKNKGLSGARNSGLKIATGKYIAFVDSDDWIEPQMYEHMLDVAIENNADIVKCGFNYTDGDVDDFVHEDRLRIIDSNIMDNYFKGALWIVVWNGVYRAELAKAVSFPEGINAEDNYATFFYLYNSNKVVMIKEVYYNYFKNNAGIRSDAKRWSEAKFNVMVKLREDMKAQNVKLEKHIQKKMDSVWARDWFHRIRDDKSLKNIPQDILKNIYANIDFRRAMQLRLILLIR